MIIETNYGIASRVNDIIYLNKRLKDHPELYKAIIEHELSHTGTFTLKDIIIDLHHTHLKNLKAEYYYFVLTNPSSWLEFSPIWYKEGMIIVNPLLSIFYLTILILGIILWLLI